MNGVSAGGNPPRTASLYSRLGKPWLDVTLVLLTLPFWLVLFLVIALLVRLIDGAPVFYREERAGRRNLPFRIYKFRTLRDSRPGLLFTDGRSPLFTRLGPFLRVSGLDELPQLLNVLRGEMSLTGPRPLPLSHPALADPRSPHRSRVRPGLSGLAQVHGRNLLTWPEKLVLDEQYVMNHSLRGDLWILLRTLPALLRGGTWFTGRASREKPAR